MRCYYLSHDNSNSFLFSWSPGLKNAQISNNQMSHFQRTPDPEKTNMYSNLLQNPLEVFPNSLLLSYSMVLHGMQLPMIRQLINLMLMSKCTCGFWLLGINIPFRSQVSCFQVSLAGISELGTGALHQTHASFSPQKLTVENSLWLKQQQWQK